MGFKTLFYFRTTKHIYLMTVLIAITRANENRPEQNKRETENMKK